MEQALKKLDVAEQLADGIYLGLDEATYHHDLALGSSDVRKLLVNPSDYWYGSPLNPLRPEDKDTPARLRGRAMHKSVLEGHEAFDKLYMRGAEHSDDMTPAEKSAVTKALNVEAKKRGLEVLPAEVYDRIIMASAMITRNPKLATAFTGGLPEVSIFWTRDGVRRKARLDYLKPRGIGDLKSIVNTREMAFKAACRSAIANYRYEIQAAHYIEARGMIAQHMANGHLNMSGTTAGKYLDSMDFLKKCADTKVYAFQFVFFQSEKAPVTWSCILSPANPVLEIARREIDRSIDNYRSFMDQFGPTQMWLELDEPGELAMDEMPGFWGRD